MEEERTKRGRGRKDTGKRRKKNREEKRRAGATLNILGLKIVVYRLLRASQNFSISAVTL